MWKIQMRELDDLTRSVNDATTVLHLRIHEERNTSLSTMENLDKGLAKPKDLVATRHGQAKENHEVLKSQFRTIEE